ncbi:MAG: hypothetical protein HOW73_39025 [Polyangiaceae bacterium]|nr:hypothetical protein [Polyangiaceae bacterium]
MKPAAKQGDQVVATDTHLVDGAPMTFPFQGKLVDGLSTTVMVEDAPAAVVGTKAQNVVIHVPPPGKSFVRPPTNRGVIVGGSSTVFIEDKPAARDGDRASTCGDPTDADVGRVVASSKVIVG